MREVIKTCKSQISLWIQSPVIDANEWDKIKGMIKRYRFWMYLLIIAEGTFNYFALESMTQGKGWFWIGVRLISAIAITGGLVISFEKWYIYVLNEPDYKQSDEKRINLKKIGLFTILCILVEYLFYYLSMRRGVALEGANGDENTKMFLVMIGMLLPVIIGYFSYEISRYISAYKNTLRIEDATRKIAKAESLIATNNQKMEDHFKRNLNDTWTVLYEFKIYKSNYNRKNGIPEESLTGHFSDTHDCFQQEAMKRYNQEILKIETTKPMILLNAMN